MKLAGVCSDSSFTRLAAGWMRCCSTSNSSRSPTTTTISPSIDAALRQVGLDRLDHLGEVAGHRLLVARADLDLVAVAEDDRAEAVPLRFVGRGRRSGICGTDLASIGATGGITGSCMAPFSRRPRRRGHMPVPPWLVDRLSVALGGRRCWTGSPCPQRRGRLTAVLGPNGAGKTTLSAAAPVCWPRRRARCGCSVLAPGRAEVAARVGLMPQSTGAWSGIRAGGAAALSRQPLRPPARRRRADRAAAASAPYAQTPYRRLSGGQQQTVNLAGALVGRPELVFLDEPTAGLDPHARRATWELLGELRTAGVTVVLTTHAMDEAAGAGRPRVHRRPRPGDRRPAPWPS